MGLGDWIMATSQVKRIHVASGQQVCVVKKDGQPVWSEVFDHNPRLSRVRPGARILFNSGGHRPYIDYAHSLPGRWAWKKWDIEPGEIYLSDDEKTFAEPYRGKILIEPNTKIEGGNKSWPWDRWRDVLRAYPGEWVQVGKQSSTRLPAVEFVETAFRQACAVLSVCKAFVGTEGALHHAAAAFSVPAVVLFSEFISPEITGYASQRSIRHAGQACGARGPCRTCRESMERITVDEVVTNLQEVIA
jgi:ADP-heptose:LPS heptosyltransferase